MAEEFKNSGLVTKKFSNFFFVELERTCKQKPQKFLCQARKSLLYKQNSVYVGDHVLIKSIDLIKKTAIIYDILPRKNLFPKPNVANLSDIFLMFSLSQPDINYNQINKFLIKSEYAQLNINIIFSKSDLVLNEFSEAVQVRIKKWGYPSHVISLESNQGLSDILKTFAKKSCSVVVGPSGVGKTSLMNYLLPNSNLPVSPVSEKTQTGVHTTRNVELFNFRKDRFIVDTPGFNIPDFEIDKHQLGCLFPEIRIQKETNFCKFNDCLHIDEPGCLLDKTWERYNLYRKMILHSISTR
tara:strand:- start:96 stop:986 length:891 start_codon:yes stop_codon:yes gene_type:complete